MKDTILNSTLIAAAFAAIVLAVVGNRSSVPEMAAVQSSQVVTVKIAAQANPPASADVSLVAYNGQ